MSMHRLHKLLRTRGEIFSQAVHNSSLGPRFLTAHPADGGQGEGGEGGWGWLRGGLLLLPAGIAGYLGMWQVDRRRWKADLIEQRQQMLSKAPQDIFALDGGPNEYLPVKVRRKEKGRGDRGIREREEVEPKTWVRERQG